MVVVALVDNIVIAMTGSILKQERQVSKVFQLLMDNKMWVEIVKCVFTVKEVTFLAFIVGGNRIRMDLDKAKEIVDWPRPTCQDEV
jgi:hypothetical protein